MNDEQVVKLVRAELKDRGMKIGFLAQKIGVAPCTLSSYLTGKRNLGASAKLLLLKVLNLESLTDRAS